jgi:hypothetical protein
MPPWNTTGNKAEHTTVAVGDAGKRECHFLKEREHVWLHLTFYRVVKLSILGVILFDWRSKRTVYKNYCLLQCDAMWSGSSWTSAKYRKNVEHVITKFVFEFTDDI